MSFVPASFVVFHIEVGNVVKSKSKKIVNLDSSVCSGRKFRCYGDAVLLSKLKSAEHA